MKQDRLIYIDRLERAGIKTEMRRREEKEKEEKKKRRSQSCARESGEMPMQACERGECRPM